MADYLCYRGDQLLGSLTQEGGDMPWWEGTFDPAPAFKQVRPLFDQLRKLDENDDEDFWVKAEAIWQEIRQPGLRLVPQDGREPITDFLINIRGREAWWRL